MKPRIKGKFTFQSAGVLFVLSAVFELFAITSPVPLLGNVRGGGLAAAYHLIYVVLFSSLGYGLFKARSWAYTLVFAATGIYTLDRLAYVLDRKALAAYLAALLDKYGVAVGIAETGIMVKVVIFAAVLTAACWWGFAGYAYLRRGYFQRTGAESGNARRDEPC